jgi:hypothetical protein
MLGQRTASRPAPFERRHHHLLARRRGCHLARRVRLRRIRLQIGELKLELIKLTCHAGRTARAGAS